MGGAHRLAASRMAAQRTSSAGLSLAFFEGSGQYNAGHKHKLLYFILGGRKMVRDSYLGTDTERERGKPVIASYQHSSTTGGSALCWVCPNQPSSSAKLSNSGLLYILIYSHLFRKKMHLVPTEV